MTIMISFLGKPRLRPRRNGGTAALIGESARLRAQLTRTAARLEAFTEELREEVDRLLSDRDEGEGCDR